MKKLTTIMIILIAAIAILISSLVLIATSPAHGFEVQIRASQFIPNHPDLKVAKHQVSAYGLEEDGVAGKTGWQVIENWDFGGYRVGAIVEYAF